MRPFVAPLEGSAVPELQPDLERLEGILGFIPNATLTMARIPGTARAYLDFALAAVTPRRIEPQLKFMVALVASAAAGCRYCQAHSATSLSRAGDDGTVAAVWSFETDARFDARERAALRLAQAAGVAPNAVTEELMAEVRGHFDDEEIVELMFMIALMGFLNRWNDSMATEIESPAAALAGEHLSGWEAGKHASPESSDSRPPSTRG